ncbi:hypothetical protein V1J52_21705 [Streptomyces sp. TRM 70351]|uniref:DUF6895 family protein n=1 Tax=Streptomyces sp. TRM 70351 TaxID=3116552 RepID=UPI002E7B5F38|nr:hypothetical protein [Streptomyces sp. TRM 70351]MEE1930773.1 hypothetical protein [Streptomyces sp. TRM 70351]
MTLPEPGRTAARHLLTGALDWLGAHLHRCTLDTGGREEHARSHKLLGETALLARVVLRGRAGGREAARTLLEHAWKQYALGDVLYERQLRHPAATDPLEVYACFRPAGYRHLPLETLLGHLHHRVSRQAAELRPNRRLAVHNAARTVGLPPAQDDRALAGATWLGRRPEPWLIDWDTAYTVTHTVYHLTDWGSRPHALPPPLRDYLHLWLPVWHDVWQEAAEWDLVGELLAVDACLPGGCLGSEAWTVLAAQRHHDGLVPRDGRPVTGPAVHRFERHFHATAVAGLAAALALS